MSSFRNFLRRALLIGILSTAILSAADPPPEVDAALRSRMQEFFQLLVAHKFRQAESLVAEDSKDFYYDARKPDIRAFKLTEIRYSPDFRSAKVMHTVTMTLPIPGAIPKPMDLPFPSEWKLEDGKWCWYVDQSKLLDTPFGRMSPGTTPAEASKVVDRIASAQSMMNAVQADRIRVPLDPAHPAPQIVTLKNTLPGPVTIQSLTNSPALKIEIAKPNLIADESTQVTITPVAGATDRPGQLELKIGPFGQIIRIALDYVAPQ